MLCVTGSIQDLFPWPGIEPGIKSALGGQSLSHWTTRESPLTAFLISAFDGHFKLNVPPSKKLISHFNSLQHHTLHTHPHNSLQVHVTFLTFFPMSPVTAPFTHLLRLKTKCPQRFLFLLFWFPTPPHIQLVSPIGSLCKAFPKTHHF